MHNKHTSRQSFYICSVCPHRVMEGWITFTSILCVLVVLFDLWRTLNPRVTMVNKIDLLGVFVLTLAWWRSTPYMESFLAFSRNIRSAWAGLIDLPRHHKENSIMFWSVMLIQKTSLFNKALITQRLVDTGTTAFFGKGFLAMRFVLISHSLNHCEVFQIEKLWLICIAEICKICQRVYFC